MKWVIKEILAVGAVIFILIGTPLGLYWYEQAVVLGSYPKECTVITLTALGSEGIFTTDDVVGNNYWRKKYLPARPILKQGKEVIFRLKSSDDHHGFAIPGLGIEAVELEPGHVTELRFTPQESGQFIYQCTIKCGDYHEEMMGTLVVLGPGETVDDYPPINLPRKKRP